MCPMSCRVVNSSCGKRIFVGFRFQRSGGRITVEFPKKTGIDPDALHRGEVDHQPAVCDGVASDVVPAAAHSNQEVVLPGEIDRVDDVGDARAASDERLLIKPFQTKRACS
jgi:hypothetical protein